MVSPCHAHCKIDICREKGFYLSSIYWIMNILKAVPFAWERGKEYSIIP